MVSLLAVSVGGKSKTGDRVSEKTTVGEAHCKDEFMRTYKLNPVFAEGH